MRLTETSRGYGHGHDLAELRSDHDREEVRLHLVANHHWPAIAHYDATAEDLDDLHRLTHDPDRTTEAVGRIRAILCMPDHDEDDHE